MGVNTRSVPTRCVVIFGSKNRFTIVAALDDVQRFAGDEKPWLASHQDPP